MRISKGIIGLAIGLGLLLLLVANAPARLLLAVLPEQQLVLQGISGTLWQGRASRSLVAVEGGWLQLGATEWTLKPFSLLLLAPRLQLESHWGRQTLVADLTLRSADTIEMNNVDLRVDAGLLRQYLPLGLVGDVAAQFETLEIVDGMPVTASGRIVWQEGGWISPQGRRSLGSYAVDLNSPEPGLIAGEVITLAGDLTAQGNVSLEQAQYRIDVTLEGSGLQDPQLSQALQLVAAPVAGGFRVQLEGQL
mgnify:FL=1